MAKKPKIDLVIPVFNEEEILRKNLDVVKKFLSSNLKEEDITIIIAENGSTDKTYELASDISKENKNVNVERFKEKGRGNAVKKSWIKSSADILIYMDVDLITK